MNKIINDMIRINISMRLTATYDVNNAGQNSHIGVYSSNI